MANLPSDTAHLAPPAYAPPVRVAVEDGPEGRLLLLFLAANVVLRLLLIPLNTGAYTDGVLQVTQASEPTSLWPPLYGWLTSCFSWAMPALYAGRLVSALAGALGLWPLWVLARRAGGKRAAFFTAILYTLAPVSLRWSSRMMTDALFASLFWAALERWDAAERYAYEGRSAESDANDQGITGAGNFGSAIGLRGPHDGRLAAATLWTAAACLARYQGVLLLPLIGVSWVRAAWRFAGDRSARLHRSEPSDVSDVSNAPGVSGQPERSPFPWRTLAAAITLLAVPLWIHFRGVAHGQQFAERLGPNLRSALEVISINGEAFLLLTPYFLTYPVALWVLFGLLRGSGKGARITLVATLYVGLTVLLLQSAFSSFQERYMLPWYGLLWVWGGIGLAIVKVLLDRRHRTFSAALALTVIWSAFVAVCVLVLQHQAFGDFAAAGRWLHDNAPPGAPIYSTEVYNPNLGGRMIATDKIRFFSHRDVHFLPPPSTTGPEIPPGSLVCLHSAYPFWTEEELVRRYQGKRVYEAESVILPLFPDIMEQPGTAQNPMAWFYRYQPQYFWTVIWQIGMKRENHATEQKGAPHP